LDDWRVEMIEILKNALCFLLGLAILVVVICFVIGMVVLVAMFPVPAIALMLFYWLFMRKG
jgi:hypothetical protein